MDPQHSPESSDSDSSEPWTLVDRVSCDGDGSTEIVEDIEHIEVVKHVAHEDVVEQKDAGVQVRECSPDVEQDFKKEKEKEPVALATCDKVEEIKDGDALFCNHEEQSQCCGNEGDLDTDGVSVISESDGSEDYVHAGRYVDFSERWQRDDSLTGSFHSNDYFDLSAQPDQELPEGWSQFKRSRKYVHNPNKKINMVLNIFLALSLAAVVGLGIGHFLGLHEECGLPQKMDMGLKSEPFNNIGVSLVLSTLRQENDFLRQQLEKLSKAIDLHSKNDMKPMDKCMKVNCIRVPESLTSSEEDSSEDTCEDGISSIDSSVDKEHSSWNGEEMDGIEEIEAEVDNRDERNVHQLDDFQNNPQEYLNNNPEEYVKNDPQENGENELQDVGTGPLGGDEYNPQVNIENHIQDDVENNPQEYVENYVQDDVANNPQEDVENHIQDDVANNPQEDVENRVQDDVEIQREAESIGDSEEVEFVEEFLMNDHVYDEQENALDKDEEVGEETFEQDYTEEKYKMGEDKNPESVINENRAHKETIGAGTKERSNVKDDDPKNAYIGSIENTLKGVSSYLSSYFEGKKKHIPNEIKEAVTISLAMVSDIQKSVVDKIVDLQTIVETEMQKDESKSFPKKMFAHMTATLSNTVKKVQHTAEHLFVKHKKPLQKVAQKLSHKLEGLKSSLEKRWCWMKEKLSKKKGLTSWVQNLEMKNVFSVCPGKDAHHHRDQSGENVKNKNKQSDKNTKDSEHENLVRSSAGNNKDNIKNKKHAQEKKDQHNKDKRRPQQHDVKRSDRQRKEVEKEKSKRLGQKESKTKLPRSQGGRNRYPKTNLDSSKKHNRNEVEKEQRNEKVDKSERKREKKNKKVRGDWEQQHKKEKWHHSKQERKSRNNERTKLEKKSEKHREKKTKFDPRKGDDGYDAKSNVKTMNAQQNNQRGYSKDVLPSYNKTGARSAAWVEDLAHGREEIRKQEQQAEWMFDRARGRRQERERGRDIDWLFDRARSRSKQRGTSSSQWQKESLSDEGRRRHGEWMSEFDENKFTYSTAA